MSTHNPNRRFTIPQLPFILALLARWPVLACSLVVWAGSASADTLYVPDQYPTIQSAIDAALEGDEVVIADGTYGGEGNRDIDFLGKAITVRSANGDPTMCIIDCEGNPEQPHRGFHFCSGEGPSSVLRGLTICHGFVEEGGGGILCCNQSSPTIEKCILSHNTAGIWGGGIACENSSVLLTDCTIHANTAHGGGGAGFHDCDTPVISNCTFSGNTAFFQGGGIAHWGAGYLWLAECRITGNSSSAKGGGVHIEGGGGNITLTNCMIDSNTADNEGGGIAARTTIITLKDCVLVGNNARSGGAFRFFALFSSGQLYAELDNCTIAGNHASYDGGGVSSTVFVDNSDMLKVDIRNCTVTGNKAAATGGGCYFGKGIFYKLRDCSIVGNTSYDGDGGGMTGRSGSAVNCLLHGNVSETGGGGVSLIYHDSDLVNCTITENSAPKGGGILCGGAQVTAANCVLWGDNATEGQGPEIAMEYQSTLIISSSDVQGGETAVHVEGEAELHWGEGNIEDDPDLVGGSSGTWTSDGAYDPQTYQITFTDDNASWEPNALAGAFVNPDITQTINFYIVSNTATSMTVWADWATISFGAWVDADDKYQVFDEHLSPGSPCIDAGDNTAVPEDVEADLDGNPRFMDDPDTEDTGFGDPPIVDMGTYEFQGESCPADVNDSGVVDPDDVLAVLAAWGTCDNCPEDINHDGTVNIDDVFAILGAWGPCP